MPSRLCPFCLKMSDSDTCPHCGKNINYAGSPAHLPVGYVVNGTHAYVLGAALGQGGFGITYIALDMVTNERVAIKEYYPTYCSSRTGYSNVTAYANQEDVFAKGKERFLDEAKTLKSLSDLENIVDVLDYFEANNSAYLVMEFLEGSSLKDYAAKNGVFPVGAFLKQFEPLMKDIHRMHERGVIHRDIAPDNIMLLPDGKMKLIDFGAARSYVGSKSMTMVVKKGYAPVEQYLSRGVTVSSDVYALAATIYFCITGKVPPDSADRQYDNTPLTSPRELGADITPQQERAIQKALKVQQKDRTQTVQEFLDDLHKKRTPILFLLPRSRKCLLLILAGLAALLAIAGIFLFSGKDSHRESTNATLPAVTVETLNPEQTGSEAEAATEATAEETAETVEETTEETEEATTEAATEPTEASVEATEASDASGKSSGNKTASNKPSSGSNSSGSSSSGSSSSGSSSSGSSSSGSSSSGSSSSGSSSSGSSSSGSSSSGGTTVVIPPPVILPPPVVVPPPVILPPPVVVPPPVILPPPILPPLLP